MLCFGEGRLKEDSWTFAILKALDREYRLDLDTPIKDLDKKYIRFTFIWN